MAFPTVTQNYDTKDVNITPAPANPGRSLLKSLFDRLIMLPEEWDELPAPMRKELSGIDQTNILVEKLVTLKLLSAFQAEAVMSGRIADLVVGHYRLLEPLGQGGMGTVYRVEHVHLRRILALKLMADGYEGNQTLLSRFFLEARAVARLQHPNLVSCLDAGRHESETLGRPVRCYYVMELIPGQDLGKLVESKGPLSVNQAAALFRQAAQALAEAHRHRLIHRDIKPSNILVTPDWQAKVLDFGLALHPQHQITNPGEFLGTVGYMAPEQAKHASAVDARADLFSLGATLFLALTGRDPFPETGNAIRDLVPRLTAAPPRVTSFRPEIPPELDDIVARLMDPNPDNRYPSAFAVNAVLTPFVRWRPAVANDGSDTIRMRKKILVADDDSSIRDIICSALSGEYDCTECADGLEAINLLNSERFDLITVDLNMPRIDGAGLVEHVRNSVENAETMILICSGEAPTETMGGLLLNGADDFIQKPMSLTELRSRVRGLLNRRSGIGKKANLTQITSSPFINNQTHKNTATVRVGADQLNRIVLTADDNNEVVDLSFRKNDSDLSATMSSRDWQPTAAQVLASTVTHLLEEANIVARGHGARVSRYVRSLSAATPSQGDYRRLEDSTYLDMLTAVAPMHDIGSLVIPGDVLQKPGRFTPDERMVVQTHTTVGSEIVVEVAAKYAQSQPFLTLAAEIVRSHHERWDGTGYPDSLAKMDIPLSARVVGLVSVYDALRSRRPYRPAVNHNRAVQLICSECIGQFDPVLLAAFVASAGQFEQIYQQHPR